MRKVRAARSRLPPRAASSSKQQSTCRGVNYRDIRMTNDVAGPRKVLSRDFTSFFFFFVVVCPPIPPRARLQSLCVYPSLFHSAAASEVHVLHRRQVSRHVRTTLARREIVAGGGICVCASNAALAHSVRPAAARATAVQATILLCSRCALLSLCDAMMAPANNAQTLHALLHHTISTPARCLLYIYSCLNIFFFLLKDARNLYIFFFLHNSIKAGARSTVALVVLEI